MRAAGHIAVWSDISKKGTYDASNVSSRVVSDRAGGVRQSGAELGADRRAGCAKRVAIGAVGYIDTPNRDDGSDFHPRAQFDRGAAHIHLDGDGRSHGNASGDRDSRGHGYAGVIHSIRHG